MGALVNGEWRQEGFPTNENGEFVRADASFRGTIDDDGKHPPARGRYHLYVSYACPWAHRTLIFRSLKGLEDVISVSAVHPFMGDDGWTFQSGDGPLAGDDAQDNQGRDDVLGVPFMRDVYVKGKSDYTGRVTVPVLWDKETASIVNNESSEIIRLFNTGFNALIDDDEKRALDFYPEALREEIDAINARVYDTVNNGVYKCGFARSQEAYEKAFVALFDTLDFLEERLSKQRYLVGDQVTEADWRLFTTLYRFDPVYVTHFKTNKRRIADYPNLSGFLRELYQWPGVKETCNLTHIKNHYFASHESVNPSRIVPLGPDVDLEQPHGREAIAA
jgi:putative glutathione S-transferase